MHTQNFDCKEHYPSLLQATQFLNDPIMNSAKDIMFWVGPLFCLLSVTKNSTSFDKKVGLATNKEFLHFGRDS